MKVGDLDIKESFPKSNDLNSKNKSCNFIPKSKGLRAICILSILFLCLIFILAIILIILFATVPCLMLKCHPKASKCINHPFKIECLCDYGYQGDGVNYCDECGVYYTSKNVKIIGGTDSVVNSWPSAVYVLFTYKGYVDIRLETGSVVSVYASKNSFCGGSLIDRKHVLTAAHCVQPTLRVSYNNINYNAVAKTNENFPTYESMLKIFIGIHDISSITSSNTFSVNKIYSHEFYSGWSILNDIALIRLNNEQTLSNNIQLACLPSKEILVYPSGDNIKSWAIGWGLINQTSRLFPNALQNVELFIYEPGACSGLAPAIPKNWNSQICAGYLAGGKGICNGDSGGSIFVLDLINGKPKYISVGIVSYGNGTCGVANNPQY